MSLLPPSLHAEHDSVLQASLGGTCLRCVAQHISAGDVHAAEEVEALRQLAASNPALLASVWSYAATNVSELLEAAIDAAVSTASHQSYLSKTTLQRAYKRRSWEAEKFFCRFLVPFPLFFLVVFHCWHNCISIFLGRRTI